MWGYAQRCASGSRARALAGRAALAAIVALGLLGAPREAQAYRHGLGSSIGGATLGRGHVLYLMAGYPTTTLGWAMALHPLVDLGVHADVAYGHPAWLGDEMYGGGGGVRARVALLRGRASLALVVDLAAIAHAEGTGVAAFVDLGSPALEISYRLGPRLALHAGLAVPLHYVSSVSSQFATQSHFVGGFEARGGVTAEVRPGLSLVGSVAWGATIWSSRDYAPPRLEVLFGLEYRLGRGDAER
jgi:hypothetical protein